MENQVQEQTLKAGAIGRGEITLMAVAGAAPVMCIGGSMHTFLSQTGTGISLAAVFATLLCIFIGLSYGNLSEKYNNCGGTYSYITEIFGKKSWFVVHVRLLRRYAHHLRLPAHHFRYLSRIHDRYPDHRRLVDFRRNHGRSDLVRC